MFWICVKLFTFISLIFKIEIKIELIFMVVVGQTYNFPSTLPWNLTFSDFKGWVLLPSLISKHV
jgi:hypothetical protein